MPIRAEVIKDSINRTTGDRVITLEVEFHRFILPEVNTYRTISRNYQSSRAIPVERQVMMIEADTAYPVHWGKNQTGMRADQECNNQLGHIDRKDAWEMARDNAINLAMRFHQAGYHKQIVNRLLEPFMFTKGVITGTQSAFEHIFTQRLHKDAQPEFKALAIQMKRVIDESDPKVLDLGQWHLPYCEGVQGTQDELVTSVSCCAQVSYRKLDESKEKAYKIYSMLNLNPDSLDPPHWSPAEHQVQMISEYDSELSGNLRGAFAQYRKYLGG